MTWQLIFYMERGGTIIVELKKWIAVSRDWYNILLEQILQEFGIMFLWWQHAFRIYLWIVEWSFLSECRLPFMFLIVMMTDVTFLNLPMPARFTVKKEDFSHMGPPPVFPVWCQRRITFISTPWYLYLALHPPIRKLLAKILIQRKHFTFCHLHLQDVHCWKKRSNSP